MTYQDILEGIAQRRANAMFIPGAQIQLDDIWWALQALAEHGKEIEQGLIQANLSLQRLGIQMMAQEQK